MGTRLTGVAAPPVRPSGPPNLAYRLVTAPGARELLVLLHGQGRAVGDLRRAYAQAALGAGFALVLPLFDETTFKRYQVLSGSAGPLAAAGALSQALDDAAGSLGADPRVHLLGFSGGAQLAHRYAMLEPQRVLSLAIVAAGWYTWPDPLVAFPYGTAPSTDAPNGLPRLAQYLGVPLRVMVGDHDTKQGASLRTSPALDAVQGGNRFERAMRYVTAVQAAALAAGVEPRVSLELLPGAGHSFLEAVGRGGLVERSMRFFRAHAGTRGRVTS